MSLFLPFPSCFLFCLFFSFFPSPIASFSFCENNTRPPPPFFCSSLPSFALFWNMTPLLERGTVSMLECKKPFFFRGKLKVSPSSYRPFGSERPSSFFRRGYPWHDFVGEDLLASEGSTAFPRAPPHGELPRTRFFFFCIADEPSPLFSCFFFSHRKKFLPRPARERRPSVEGFCFYLGQRKSARPAPLLLLIPVVPPSSSPKRDLSPVR